MPPRRSGHGWSWLGQPGSDYTNSEPENATTDANEPTIMNGCWERPQRTRLIISRKNVQFGNRPRPWPAPRFGVQTLGVVVAQASREWSPSEIVVIAALATLIVGYLYGKYYAVWGRARRDYSRVKQSVPDLRTAMWRAFWKVVQAGTFVAITMIVLMVLLNNAGTAVSGR